LGAVLALAGLLVPRVAWGQEVADRVSMQGLKGVFVVVEDLPAEVQEKGLTRAKIQAMIEEKIGQAGLVVLTREAWLRTPGTPLLYANVNLSAARTKEGTRACSINLSLAQRVSLERDPSLRNLGRTWQTGIVGLVADGEYGLIQGQVGVLVDYFLSEVRAVS
jgi:hypothetical protein